MTAPADYFMTVEELAAEQRLAEGTLYSWRARGFGPKSTKRGRRIVYRRSDVLAWLEANEAETARGGVA